MYETGKAAQVAREMGRYNVQILGLSEVRWNMAGRTTLASGETVLHSGPPDENATHRHGVGFMLNKQASKSLMEWEPVSERIITARFESKFQKVTLVQCYAPTNVDDQQVKEDYYRQLQGVMDKIARRDIVLVIGDMNAKLGSDNTGREFVMGKEGVGEINENGELFADFCGQNDLVIGGTIFPHKKVHKTTWTSPDQATQNQIDHMAISRRWRRTMEDVRAYRGADAGSDHELVIARLRVKLARTPATVQQRTQRYDTSRLATPDQRHEFVIALSNRFQALTDQDDDSIDTKWEQTKSSFQATCEEKLGHRKRTYKSWLSQETIEKIEERRAIKNQLLQAKTRAQKQAVQREYKEQQKEVRRSTRQDKRNTIDQLATKAQEAAAKNDTRTLYDITRKLSGRKTNNDKPVRGLDGETLTKPADQLERWKEHFSHLLSGTPVEHPPDIDDGEQLPVNMGPITTAEIVTAIAKIKLGKAPGPDNIPPEALKADTTTSAQIMQGLIQDIWEKEEIPTEWKTGHIVKLPKKGDLGDCQNWRGIQLLSIPSKVLTRILLERLKTAVNDILRDEQAGFRAGRSCIDQIATLRIILEQSLEWQSPVYVNFIDFRKAFDMVDRSTIWRIMRHYGIPPKIVNIIRSFYDGMTCQVIHNKDLSAPFTVTTGVRQGCLLSPMIFSLVIDWVLNQTMDQPRGLQWNFVKTLEDLDFADDVGLLSHSFKHIQEKSQRLGTVAQQTGLEVNTQKTKSLRINAQSNTHIRMAEHEIEDVDHFTYLGSKISKSGGTEEDIKARIGKARHAFVMLKPVWNNRNIHLKTKISIFNSNVKSVLLYGSETWKHTKALDHKLQVFVNTCLRQILHIRWPDRISNEELWRRTKQRPLPEAIKERKWRWVGHTLRRDQTNITRQALDWNPQGKRRRGRPTTTWRRTLDAELRSQGISWGEAKRKAQDRTGWKAVVRALCSGRDEED